MHHNLEKKEIEKVKNNVVKQIVEYIDHLIKYLEKNNDSCFQSFQTDEEIKQAEVIYQILERY